MTPPSPIIMLFFINKALVLFSKLLDIPSPLALTSFMDVPFPKRYKLWMKFWFFPLLDFFSLLQQPLKVVPLSCTSSTSPKSHSPFQFSKLIRTFEIKAFRQIDQMFNLQHFFIKEHPFLIIRFEKKREKPDCSVSIPSIYSYKFP